MLLTFEFFFKLRQLALFFFESISLVFYGFLFFLDLFKLVKDVFLHLVQLKLVRHRPAVHLGHLAERVNERIVFLR